MSSHNNANRNGINNNNNNKNVKSQSRSSNNQQQNSKPKGNSSGSKDQQQKQQQNDHSNKQNRNNSNKEPPKNQNQQYNNHNNKPKRPPNDNKNQQQNDQSNIQNRNNSNKEPPKNQNQNQQHNNKPKRPPNDNKNQQQNDQSNIQNRNNSNKEPPKNQNQQHNNHNNKPKRPPNDNKNQQQNDQSNKLNRNNSNNFQQTKNTNGKPNYNQHRQIQSSQSSRTDIHPNENNNQRYQNSQINKPNGHQNESKNFQKQNGQYNKHPNNNNNFQQQTSKSNEPSYNNKKPQNIESNKSNEPSNDIIQKQKASNPQNNKPVNVKKSQNNIPENHPKEKPKKPNKPIDSNMRLIINKYTALNIQINEDLYIKFAFDALNHLLEINPKKENEIKPLLNVLKNNEENEEEEKYDDAEEDENGNKKMIKIIEEEISNEDEEHIKKLIDGYHYKIKDEEVLKYIKKLEVPDNKKSIKQSILLADNISSLDEEQTEELFLMINGYGKTQSQQMQEQLLQLNDKKQELFELFNKLNSCLVPNKQHKAAFEKILGPVHLAELNKKLKKKQKYSILNLLISNELIADFGLVIIELLINQSSDDKIKSCYKQIKQSIINNDEYDPSEIMKLFNEYPIKLKDEEIYNFLMDIKPPKEYRSVIERINTTKKIQELDGESVNVLVNILNKYPSKVSLEEKNLKKFIDENDVNAKEAIEVFDKLKGHLMLTNEMKKSIKKFRSNTMTKKIGPLLKFVKKNIIFLEMYDQEHVKTIKGREISHNITQNDLQFIFKMNNLIKSKTKYIQNAEKAFKTKMNTKIYFKKAPEDIKNVIGKQKYPMTCKPAFEVMKKAFEILSKLEESIKNDAVNCMIKAINMMNSKYQKSIELEVQIFTFGFNVDSGDLKIKSVLKIQGQLLNHNFNKKPKVIIESTTGSGKTLIVPALLMQKICSGSNINSSINYIVMTQPSFFDILEKQRFFKEHYNFSVFIHIEKFKKHIETDPNIPALLLLTPIQAIKFYKSIKTNDLKKYIFCIDEYHNRQLGIDVLYSLIMMKKAPLILMSATPDENFGRPDLINRDDKLFPVDERNIMCKSNVIDETFDQTIQIMKEMKECKIGSGHILVFTSGNKFSKILLSKLYKQKDIPVLIVKRLRNETQDNFMKRLDSEIKKNKDEKFMFLPIQMAGFLQTWEKSFVRSTPKKYSNIIKIIVSTNAMETSLTIDRLKCVIDSGVYNEAKFDKETGITTIQECPITLSMQKQREGRVGRTSPGISVKITSQKLEDIIIPEISKMDLAQAILLMRGLGVKLEDLKLPTCPKKDEFIKQLNILKNNDILDTNNNLTPKGQKLSIFADFPPFIGGSIIDYDQTPEGQIFSALVALIIFNCNEKTITEKNKTIFCPESDLVTLVSKFIDVLPSGSGLFMRDYIAISNSLKQITQSLYTDKKIDLFIIQNELTNFLKEKNLFDEINKFISCLDKENHKWLEIRKASFNKIIEKDGNKEFLFDGSPNIAENSTISLTGRPLWSKNCTIPKNAYIFSIKKDEVNKIISGCLIHSLPGSELLPEHLKVPNDLDNPFGHALIQGYLSDDEIYELFERFNDKIIDFEDADMVFMPNKEKKEEAVRIIYQAFSACSKIIIFTPRSILLRGYNPRCHCEMIGTGSQDSSTYIYTDGDHPHAYKLDKNIIDYIGQEKKIKELEVLFPQYRICMTAEGFNALATEHMNDPSIEGDSIYCTANHLFLISEPVITCGRTLLWECLADPLSARERLSIASNPNIHASECNLYVVYKGSLELNGVWDNDEKINGFYELYSNYKKSECEEEDKTDSDIPEKIDTEITEKIDTEITEKIDTEITEKIDLENPVKIDSKNPMKIVNYISEFYIDDDILIHDVDITDIKGSEKMELKYIIKCIDDEETLIKKNDDFVIFSSNKNESLIQNAFKNEKNIIINQISGVVVSVQIQNDKIPQIIKSFGCLINEGSSNKYYFFNADSAIAFMKKINNECAEIKNIALNLPEVPISFYSYPPTRKIINDWVINHITPTGTVETLTKGDLMIKDMPIYFVTLQNCKDNDEQKEIINKCKNKKWLTLLKDNELTIARANESEIYEIFGISNVEKKNGTLFVINKPKTIYSVYLQKMKHLTPINNPILWFANFEPENDDKIIEILKRHFQFNPKTTNIESHINYPVSLDGPMIEGSCEEISRLLHIYSFDPIEKFPYKIVPISVFRKEKVKEGWYIDQLSHSVVVPESDAEEAKAAFANYKIDETDMGLLFCIDVCNGSKIKIGSKVPVYDEDKTFIMHSMCHDCVLAAFKNYTSSFYVDQQLKLDQISIIPEFPLKPELKVQTDDVEWPQIPLGRLFLTLIKEPDIAPYLRAWVSGRMSFIVRFSGRCTSCPIHNDKQIFIEMEKDPENPNKSRPKSFNCPIPGCDFIFDGPTRQWYKKGQKIEAIVPRVHHCPRCNTPIVKVDGCDMIKCICGCFWCYRCEIGQEQDFRTAKECYKHIMMVHKNELLAPVVTYEKRNVDVVFLIDATGSMRNSIKAAHEKSKVIAEEFNDLYQDTEFRFSCICYRDPIDCPNHDINEFCQFDSNIDTMVQFLSTVKAKGGGDVPEDIAGGFEIALNQIEWNEGPKNIILIADAPAHGELFCGHENHEDQTERFINVIKKVAEKNIFLTCIAIKNSPINCFKQMEKIYKANNGPSFQIAPFTEIHSRSIPISDQIGKKIHDESYRILVDSYQHYYENDDEE